MTSISGEDVAAFIADLNALAEKHGLYIGGCGCCDSPYLVGTDGVSTNFGNLEYDTKKQGYFIWGNDDDSASLRMLDKDGYLGSL